jgi:hypothetical protein
MAAALRHVRQALWYTDSYSGGWQLTVAFPPLPHCSSSSYAAVSTGHSLRAAHMTC